MNLTIQEALNNFKLLIETAILNDGSKGKTAVIRSSLPILNIHEAVKLELMRHGIAPERLYPPVGARKPELKLAGSLKQKNQDICITPVGLKPEVEIMSDGYLKGTSDLYGERFTEKTISINVRSQISSLQKNFDTLFERTLNEAQNLHDRCHKMCLGEVYMIAVPEYDDKEFDNKTIAFKRSSQKVVEQYIRSFQSINNRIEIEKNFYQYERVCLLIVNFAQDPPQLYNSGQELYPAESGLRKTTIARQYES